MHIGGRKLAVVTTAAIAVAGLAACSSSGGGSSDKTTAAGGTSGTSSGGTTNVTLQLQWQWQGQFAGYAAADKEGFYKAQGLNVKIVPAGSDTVPQTTVDDGGSADYAIAWVPKALQSKEKGADITDVGQVFQRSGTLQISFKDKNINSVADLKGKNVGDWGYGNEYELFAGMGKAGLDPGSDVNIVQQAFDMNGFLKGDIDAAQAMIYNEYALVLESKNPKTGKLYQPSDLNVINWNDEGTAMLQDAIWANTKKLQDPAFQATTVKFLTASYQGWIWCAQNMDKCAADVLAEGAGIGKSHQTWMTNQSLGLVFPSPNGIGMVDKSAWDQTVQIALGTKNADGDTVLTKQPGDDAYTNDYTQKALDNLKGMNLDTTGANFKPATVTLNPNGA